MDAQSQSVGPAYPLQLIAQNEAKGELVFAYGRLFARDRKSGRWAIVDESDGETTD
jgi:hypothetical protein